MNFGICIAPVDGWLARSIGFGPLTDRQFAEIGCSHYTLKELVAAGAVGCTRLKSVSRGNTVPVFEPEEIARFKREYISMKDAAKYLGAHSRSVAAKVAPLGITPAIDIKDLPASSYFLRREIEACEQYAFESVRTRKSRLERTNCSTSAGGNSR